MSKGIAKDFMVPDICRNCKSRKGIDGCNLTGGYCTLWEDQYERRQDMINAYARKFNIKPTTKEETP